MSNLSLSFSFYFWWLNYALSVTLTNSLAQAVDVKPDEMDYWYGYNTLSFTTKARGTNSSVTYNTQNVYMAATHQQGVSFGEAYVYFSMDLTNINEIQVLFEGSTSSISGDDVAHFVTYISASATAWSGSPTQRVALNSSGNEIVTLDVSSVSGTQYVTCGIDAFHDASGNPCTVTTKMVAIRCE